jgi:EAL domain-containing protein (putative c-di-GMP-specific phosphodiesterase class I)
MVSASGLPASVLCLEITESEALSEQALPALTALREAGFGLAIDDFGVGHSSLARLRDLPATLVKLDRRFVERLPGTERDRAFFRGMTQLTTALGLTTVAEGVETPAQLQALRDAGCDACQGYLLGAPMPSGDVAGFLRRGGLRI